MQRRHNFLSQWDNMQMEFKLQAPSPHRMSEKYPAECVYEWKNQWCDIFLLGYSQSRFHKGTK